MLPGDPGGALQVEAGDVIVVPQGETHLLGSATDLSSELMAPLLTDQVDARPGEVMTLAHGGGGPVTRMVCGFLTAQEIWRNPLLSALPRLFKVGMRGSGASWLESSLRFATEEAASAHAGRATVLAKLAELVFVEAVRRYVDTMPEDRTGWLAGLRDRFVARALTLMHARPSHPWTVEDLASRVGHVAFRARAAFRGPARSSADAIPGAMALAARRAATSPWRPTARVGRGGRRLRIRSRFQSRLQTGVRCAACHLAQERRPSRKSRNATLRAALYRAALRPAEGPAVVEVNDRRLGCFRTNSLSRQEFLTMVD